jgi:hypothetical protein
MAVAGLADGELWARMPVKHDTDKTHAACIYRRLNAGTRSQAVSRPGNWACWRAGRAFSIAPGQPVARVFPGTAAGRSDAAGGRASRA